jgi:hypothetical protein
MQVDRDYIKAQRDSIERARVSGDDKGLAVGLYELGTYFQRHGMLPLAISILEEACQIFQRSLPDDDRTMAAIVSLASLHVIKGNFAEAEKLYDKQLSLRCQALGWRHHHDLDEGYDQGNMAAVYIVRHKCVVRFQ